MAATAARKCAWNRFAHQDIDPRLSGTEQDDTLLNLSAATFDSFFAGRPQRRIGWSRFRRNLLVALWSSQRHGDVQRLIAQGGDELFQRQKAELGLTSLATPHTAPHE